MNRMEREASRLTGTEAGIRTILVYSGVTTLELIETCPYRPSHIFEDVGHIPVAELG
jgi:NagD protein